MPLEARGNFFFFVFSFCFCLYLTFFKSLPTVFLSPIRSDLVNFVHTNMAKNHRQAYAVSDLAGHQTAAISWGTGRAVSRIPRVPGSGTSRSGQGAFGNMCRKGRMFAPTRQWRKWHRKVKTSEEEACGVCCYESFLLLLFCFVLFCFFFFFFFFFRSLLLLIVLLFCLLFLIDLFFVFRSTRTRSATPSPRRWPPVLCPLWFWLAVTASSKLRKFLWLLPILPSTVSRAQRMPSSC